VGVIFVTSALLAGRRFLLEMIVKKLSRSSLRTARSKESAKLRGEPVFNNGFQGNTAVSVHSPSHCLTACDNEHLKSVPY
jgi:hypothetical protein